MTVQMHVWENRLLNWAHEALDSHKPGEHVVAESGDLESAYDLCAAITRENSRTFYMASGLLPADKRRAVRALYAFCRVTDNIADINEGDFAARAALDKWRVKVMSPHSAANDAVMLAWADTLARYHIPRGYAQQLIDGVARDLMQKRYETFADLAEYSYGVASTVGLMAMHIIGYHGQDALPHAVKLGVALQMTNILRDIAEDWRAGRLYLPLEELAAFGLRESDIAVGVVDDRWREFMRFQIGRTRRLYAESWEGIALLNADGRFAITAAAELYRAILGDIEAHDFDVFNRRAHVRSAEKLLRLPGIWWRVQGM
jgi:phytoene synthase